MNRLITERENPERSRGQALLEFAAVIPLILLLVVLAVNFGGLINVWINVENATRAAADYAVLDNSSAGLPIQANSSKLMALINADLASLPNLAANLTACVQENNNGHYTPLMEMPAAGVCVANYAYPPSDGEAINGAYNYANVAVDITYTYTAFFSGPSFMGLPLTILPGSVHQRTVMRLH